MRLLPLAHEAATYAAFAARDYLRVRPSVACEAATCVATSACDRQWHARLPLARPLLHTAASACGRRLMRLPSSLNRLVIGSVANAVDMYAHSVLPQGDRISLKLSDLICEGEGGQMSSSIVVSTWWIDAAMLLNS
ncbi:hypothetical protein B296_00044717 [Ensete ventricosum]|uniref:Uncharacterized protein n=1 Tax=Ensete ventricosum TaxID=4639 RepID=A0A426XNT7_ENSVE|nr:hypothetical protein B296_00044717 [Ensete ventricosum]